MNGNKLTFESESLIVDYITFNIKGLTDPKKIAKIAFYLFESFGFNSQIKENYENHFEDLISENQNQGKVSFIRFNSKFNPYWNYYQLSGTKCSLSIHPYQKEKTRLESV